MDKINPPGGQAAHIKDSLGKLGLERVKKKRSPWA